MQREDDVKCVTLDQCSSCGETHIDVPIHALDKPKKINGLTYTHYLTCPRLHETVYVLFI